MCLGSGEPGGRVAMLQYSASVCTVLCVPLSLIVRSLHVPTMRQAYVHVDAGGCPVCLFV